jgi:hypothetical protein
LNILFRLRQPGRHRHLRLILRRSRKIKRKKFVSSLPQAKKPVAA